MKTIRSETIRSDRRAGRLRWVARLILVVPLVVAWFVAIGNAVNDLSADFEGIVLVVGLIVTTLVAIIAWFRERLGGLLLIGLAVVVGVLSYLASNPHNVGAGVFTMLPWLVSGVLFVMVDHMEHRNSRRGRHHDRGHEVNPVPNGTKGLISGVVPSDEASETTRESGTGLLPLPGMRRFV